MPHPGSSRQLTVDVVELASALDAHVWEDGQIPAGHGEELLPDAQLRLPGEALPEWRVQQALPAEDTRVSGVYLAFSTSTSVYLAYSNSSSLFRSLEPPPVSGLPVVIVLRCRLTFHKRK